MVQNACKESWPEGVRARHIIFLGADVDAKKFRGNVPEWACVRDRCETFTNYYNNEVDYALSVSDLIRLWTAPRLGRGPASHSIPKQRHVDCTGVFKSCLGT